MKRYIRFVTILFLLTSTLLLQSCTKNNLTTLREPIYTPPPFSYPPKQIYDRFYSYVGIYYGDADIEPMMNDYSRPGTFYIGVWPDEYYPSDSIAYFNTVMKKDLKTYYDLLFHDQKGQSYMAHYNLYVTKFFKLEPGDQYHKMMSFVFPLTDSTFN